MQLFIHSFKVLIFLRTHIQAQHRIQLQQEQKRTNEAEQQIRNVSNQSEERVSCLETKLSELSGVVGQYERLRYQVNPVKLIKCVLLQVSNGLAKQGTVLLTCEFLYSLKLLPLPLIPHPVYLI